MIGQQERNPVPVPLIPKGSSKKQKKKKEQLADLDLHEKQLKQRYVGSQLIKTSNLTLKSYFDVIIKILNEIYNATSMSYYLQYEKKWLSGRCVCHPR